MHVSSRIALGSRYYIIACPVFLHHSSKTSKSLLQTSRALSPTADSNTYPAKKLLQVIQIQNHAVPTAALTDNINHQFNISNTTAVQ